MRPTILEVDPRSVLLPSPDLQEDPELVEDHLFAYLNRLDKLPAITIRIDNGQAVAIRGGIYVKAAVALGRSRIRAIVDSRVPDREIGRLVRSTNAKPLDWEQEMRLEPTTHLEWYVLFIQRWPEVADLRTLERRVREFFTGLVPDREPPRIERDPVSRSLVIQAWIPAGNYWFTDLLRLIRTIDESIVPIDTFQGRRWHRSDPKT